MVAASSTETLLADELPEAGLIKGAWSSDEDTLLIDLVEEIGAKKWSLIAARMPGRIGKQVGALTDANAPRAARLALAGLTGRTALAALASPELGPR